MFKYTIGRKVSIFWNYGKHIFSSTYQSNLVCFFRTKDYNIAPPSEFVSSSIPSWQILTAHAQPFRGARDLAFCLTVPLDSLLVWASSEGSGETARMRRLAWTFAARIDYKYQIRLARPIYPSIRCTYSYNAQMMHFINEKFVQKTNVCFI